MKKFIALCLIASTVMVFAACGAAGGGYTSDQSCCWCRQKPTKVFYNEDGEEWNLCESCATTCFYCGEPATNQCENLAGMVMFVCDDCL